MQIERSFDSRVIDETQVSDRAPEWFLVHAKIGREFIARTNLERQGFATFMPLQRRTVRHARRITQGYAAFFPGYMFVQADRSRQSLRPISSTIGVLRLVANPNGEATRAPTRFVDLLRASCDAQGVLQLRDDAFKPGDAVRIVSGPLADREGIVEGLCGPDRVGVLLKFMHAEMRLTAPTKVLQKAG